MKKRKTRKQKIKLGIKREISYIKREIDTDLNIETDVEHDENQHIDQVYYSKADYLATRRLYFIIRLQELQKKLKQLNKKCSHIRH